MSTWLETHSQNFAYCKVGKVKLTIIVTWWCLLQLPFFLKHMGGPKSLPTTIIPTVPVQFQHQRFCFFFSTYTYSFLQSISGVITFYIHFLSHFKLIWGTDGYKWIRHMADFSPSILEPSVAILQHYWASWACGLSGRNVIALKLWTKMCLYLSNGMYCTSMLSTFLSPNIIEICIASKC